MSEGDLEAKLDLLLKAMCPQCYGFGQFEVHKELKMEGGKAHKDEGEGITVQGKAVSYEVYRKCKNCGQKIVDFSGQCPSV